MGLVMSILLLVVSAICCTVGLVELIGIALVSATCPPECRNTYSVIPVYGQDEDVELKLRWAENSLRWDHFCGNSKLIILNIDADEETLRVCQTFMRTREWVVLCDPSDLVEVVGDPGVYKTFKGVLY